MFGNQVSSSRYHANIAYPSYISNEEVQTLAQRIVVARQQHDEALEAQAKHRLVEAYQLLIVSLAKRYVARYRSFHMFDVSDFVQEGSLALFQALDSIDFTAITSFRAYSIAIIRAAFVRVHYGSDNPISMSRKSYYRVKKEGTLDDYRYFVSSLEAPLYEEAGTASDTLLDRIPTAPLIALTKSLSSTSCCPELLLSLDLDASESANSVVEKLLTSLPIRQEQVLRLRYGLDGCTYTQEETAHLLGLSRNTINATEQCALQNLRTRGLSLGQRSTRSLALKGNKNACHRTEAGVQKVERQRQEREERLWTAYRQLQAQGVPVTRDALCRVAHTDNRAVSEFLHERRREEPPSQKVPSVEERLHRAYTELESNGEKPTIKRLRQLAHVQSDVASTFLRSRGVPLKLGRSKKSKQEVGMEEMFNVTSSIKIS